MKTEKESFRGIASTVEEVRCYHGPEKVKVIKVKDSSGKLIGEFPLPKDHNINQGEVVEITPVTKNNEGGGSLTTFQIKTVK